MELLKMSTCLCLVLVLLADVMLARPAATDEASELEKFVENLEANMAESSKTSRRRRRRHTMVRDLAIMEFCIKRPHTCRQEIRRLERQMSNDGHRAYTVVVISK